MHDPEKQQHCGCGAVNDKHSAVPKLFCQNSLLHSLIEDRARLSRSHLSLLSSTTSYDFHTLWQSVVINATHFRDRGVRLGSKVAIIAHSSPAAVIALFAVLKAGGVCIPLSASLPNARIQKIIQICNASFFVAPGDAKGGFDLPNLNSLQVIEQPYPTDAVQEFDVLAEPETDDPAVIVFTSGSTGEPKGVVHTHKSLCTMAVAVGQGLCITPGTRNLLFPAFGWAVNLIDTFSTLVAGACLCIPTPAEKSQNLEGTIAWLQATRTTVPPSLLATIKAENVPSLVSVAVAGEPISSGIHRTWSSKATLYWNYGSSETVMVLAGRLNDATGDKLNAGYPLSSSRCFIVDEHGQELPSGHIGELVVESHCNFIGYLKDGEICRSGTGPRGCPLIHTGDLFERNCCTGLLIHRGRLNSQLKILGQRLEPMEVENHLWAVLRNVKELAVTVSTMRNSSSPVLVTLLVLDAKVTTENLHSMVLGSAFDQLVKVLPSYMIPSGVLVAQRLPKLDNGKLDRRSLPRFVEQIEISTLLDLRPPTRIETSDVNRALIGDIARIWGEVLAADSSKITTSSSFFLLGGNSLDAMGVCKALRSIGIKTSISDIFLHPRLNEFVDFIASQTTQQQDASRPEVEVNSLVATTDTTTLHSMAAEQCGVDTDRIEEVFPCPALQSGMMVLSQVQEGTYIADHTFELPRNWSGQAFVDAWLSIAATIPILRTRIVQDEKGRLFNAVLRFDGNEARPLECLPFKSKMTYGSPLFSHTLRPNTSINQYVWHWRIHHSLYDRWSTNLIIDQVEHAYHQHAVTPLANFSLFARSALNQEYSEQSKQFWQTQLGSFTGVPFPHLTQRNATTLASNAVEFNTAISRFKTSTTQATSIQLALATVLSRMHDVSDIVFGMTVHGRVIPGCPEADRVVGPAIATIPVRIHVDQSMNVQDHLEYIQKQVALMSAHEHYGLQNIQSLGAGPASAASFTTLLIIQSEVDSNTTKRPHDIVESTHESSQNYLDYPLAFECFPHANGIKTKLMYDPKIFSQWEIETMSSQFDTLLTQLESCKDSSMAIADLDPLNGAHKLSVMQMSCQDLIEYRQCLHERIYTTADKWSSEPALDGWDAKYSYSELCQLSQTLGKKLVGNFGSGPGTIVPICYPKSTTAIVAMLATLSAGYGFLMIDPALPAQRIRHMVETLKSKKLICSLATQDALRHLEVDLVLFEDILASTAEDVHEPQHMQCSPDSPAYCIFTSGSTGLPKAVLLLHKQVTSGLQSHCEAGLYVRGSRLLQFCGYSFDTYISDIFATLLSGGCVCIPKDEARLTHIAENINQYSADTIDLTPSVARLIEPEAVPQLKLLRLGGEPITDYHIRKWAKHCNLQNAYGPSECVVQCTFVNNMEETSSPSIIGKGIGCNTWVVDPWNNKFLAPLGAVGELAIQGPAVAAGYIGNTEKTGATFLERAPWLDTYNVECNYATYLTGDLVKYDEQGNLHYIGRKDNQIKIRGQRVELGEIEHVLEQDAFTNLAVVSFPSTGPYASQLIAVLKSSQTTSQSSSSYLASLDQLPRDTAEWIVKIKTKAQEILPAHMVPSAFLVLSNVPFLPSDKVDRKTLQKWLESLSDEDLATVNAYQPTSVPETLTSTANVDETLISEITAKVQSLSSWHPNKSQINISSQAPFSTIGLDSITIVALFKWVNKKYHANIDMQTMLCLETIQNLAWQIQSEGKNTTPGADLMEESFIDIIEQGVVRLGPRSSQEHHFRKILLTGGSGFVGLHILREILNRFPSTHVAVLIRNCDTTNGKADLIERIRRIGAWNDAFADRVEVWPGNLAKEQLGLSPERWAMLCGHSEHPERVDGIIHNGAVVDWFQGFQALRKVNIDASLELVRCTRDFPSIQRMIYVSGGPQWDPNISDETALSDEYLRDTLAHSNAYGQTKVITGSIIQRAAARYPDLGLKLAVVRPALVIGSSTGGVPNIDDFIWRVVMGCHAIGAYPEEDPTGWVYLSGGDTFASIVLDNLTASPSQYERKVHNGLPVSKFWQVVNEVLPNQLQCLEYGAWLQRLKQDIAANGVASRCQPVIHMIELSPQLMGAIPPRTEDVAWVQRTADETALTVRRNLQYMLEVGCFSTPQAAWSSKVFTRSKIR